jgi:hypothetical protein
MKKDTQPHKFPQKLKGDWDLIGQQQPKPNDPLIGDPRMKGRRWTINWDHDSGKTFSKLKERFSMANNDTYVDPNDWDINYKEFYEHLTENKLTGGVGDSTATSDVDPVELSMGQTVEMEHTTDPNIATEIALDHLSEDPHYYTKLRKAGLAKELDLVNASSGFGDPDHPINDLSRLGSDVTCTPGNNIVGNIGNTPNGQIQGKDSSPIVNKNVGIDIDIEEPVYSSLEEAILAEKKKKKKRKPIPTIPSLWARAKAAARAKFDVYPSAYANGWAAKWYKRKGGGWRMS